MKKMIAMILAAGAMSGFAAPTANEDFVVAEDAKTYTNAVQAAKEYTDAAIQTAIGSIPPPAPSMTTNAVCNIVTNEVVVDYTEWAVSPSQYDGKEISVFKSGDGWVPWVDYGTETEAQLAPPIGDDASLSLMWPQTSIGEPITATRQPITQNALGHARLVDLPPLTNGLPTMADIPSTNGFVTAGTTSNIVDSALDSFSSTGSVKYLSWLDEEGNWNNSPLYFKVDTGRDIFSVWFHYYQTWFDLPTKIQMLDAVYAAAQANTNYTDSAISSADTTYKSFALTSPTNVNQSVQFLNIASLTPSTIDIPLPAGGGTKDWIIYIYAATNVTLRLPAATWWMADAASTNDIAPQTPTALYFSQAAEGTFTMGRQEFTEVVLP